MLLTKREKFSMITELMKGLCKYCEAETSTPKTKQCKKCYIIHLREACRKKNRKRDKAIVHDIVRYDLHSLWKYHNAVLKGRKLAEKLIKFRICEICGATFLRRGSVNCSDDCRAERLRILQSGYRKKYYAKKKLLDA